MQTMKTIYNRLDKEYIKDLPLVSFPGKIITVNSEREADKAVPFCCLKIFWVLIRKQGLHLKKGNSTRSHYYRLRQKTFVSCSA